MRLPGSILAFVATSVSVAVGWATLRHSGVGAGLAFWSLMIGVLVGLAAWFQTPREDAWPVPKMWDWIMIGVFALVSLRTFLWVVYRDGDDIKVLSPNNLGDLSLHIQFIRNFASGVPFWPQSPILSGVPLTYPLGVDFFNSLLLLRGVSLQHGLVWTGLGGAALVIYTMWRWGGAFALAMFLFNGGFAALAWFHGVDFTDYQAELTWKNFFLSMLVTQRGLLYVLPAGLYLLFAWREEFFRGKRRAAPAWLQVLLYATMPLFNIHAFLFLSVMQAVIFLTSVAGARGGERAAGWPLLWRVGVSVVPATLCVVLVTGGFSTNSGIGWNPSWMVEPHGGWLFWLKDFGISLPLIVVLFASLATGGDYEARCFTWTAAVIFVVCAFVSFAPWPWDNMKLMLWSWLMIAPYLWIKLIRPIALPWRAVVLVLMFFSGAVCLAAGLDKRHGYTIGNQPELNTVEREIAGIPVTARFACVPDYNNPLILLGRDVACGYEGHLWSHGLKYHEKLDALHRLLVAAPGWQNDARMLGTDYLFIRKNETGTAPVTWAAGLYDLRPSLASPAGQPLRLQSADLPGIQ